MNNPINRRWEIWADMADMAMAEAMAAAALLC
jgi:hypothetical protein